MLPLQTGADTSNGLLAGAIGLALLVSAVAIVAVVSRDAAARGVSEPRRSLLSVGAALFPVPVFAAYILFASRIGERGEPVPRVDRIAGWLAASAGIAVLNGALFSPPDPVTQLRYAAGLFVALAVLLYIPAFRRGPFVGDG
ncbi:hypothetical protein [Halorubrum sp. N11]|uniref:hypothetical protein n=1 Tax=Halorubrum sp. N11 TaxID=3402276 RepID=UPI003EBFBA68